MKIKEYIKQLSIVIFGILVAFWINNIGMDHKERTTQKQVLFTILNELKDNQQEIKIMVNSLDTLHTTFTKIQQVDKLPGSSEISVRYTRSNLKCIGYEIAKYTGILKDIDHKLVSEIVESYEYQLSLNELETSMRDELFEFFKYKKKDSIDYLIIQISTLRENLERLKVEQKQLIDDLTAFFN